MQKNAAEFSAAFYIGIDSVLEVVPFVVTDDIT